MIKPYRKESPVSYTEGFFPTFEMLRYHPESFERLYVALDAVDSDGLKKLKEQISDPERIVVSAKPFEVLKCKENAHVLGVFKKFVTRLDPKQDHLLLVSPSDMGNLGNAMRTLLAFGFHDLAVVEPAADLFSPKTVRASMGAIFHLRMETFKTYEDYRKAYPRAVYPFVLAKSKPLSEVTFDSPCALAFGNEATGLPKEIYNENDVRIEQSDEVDSLNLTTSIAVALYQLRQQKSR